MLNRYVFAGFFCGALVVGGIIGSAIFFVLAWTFELAGDLAGKTLGVW